MSGAPVIVDLTRKPSNWSDPDDPYEEQSPLPPTVSKAGASHQGTQPFVTHSTISKDQTGDLHEVERRLLATVAASFQRALVQFNQGPDQSKAPTATASESGNITRESSEASRASAESEIEPSDGAERPPRRGAHRRGPGPPPPPPANWGEPPPPPENWPGGPPPPPENWPGRPPPRSRSPLFPGKQSTQPFTVIRTAQPSGSRTRPRRSRRTQPPDPPASRPHSAKTPVPGPPPRRFLRFQNPSAIQSSGQKPTWAEKSQTFDVPPCRPSASTMSSLQQPIHYAASAPKKHDLQIKKAPMRPAHPSDLLPSRSETLLPLDQTEVPYSGDAESSFSSHGSSSERLNHASDIDDDDRQHMELSEFENEVSHDYEDTFQKHHKSPSQCTTNFRGRSSRLHSSAYLPDREGNHMHRQRSAQHSFLSGRIRSDVKMGTETTANPKHGFNGNLVDAKNPSRHSKRGQRPKVFEKSKIAASQTLTQHKDAYNSFSKRSMPRRDTSASVEPAGAHLRKQADWRSLLCNLLRTSDSVADDVLMEALEVTTKKLEIAESTGKIYLSLDPAARYHTIHKIHCTNSHGRKRMYLDPPKIIYQVSGDVHLQSHAEIDDLEVHIKPYQKLAFVVYKHYSCCTGDVLPQGLGEGDITKLMKGESVCIISNEFYEGLMILKDKELKGINNYYPKFGILKEFHAPYLWLYHQRIQFETNRKQLPPRLLNHVNVFVDYINENFGLEYAAVDMLLAQGLITAQYLPYLYAPNSILFNNPNERQGRTKAQLAESWLSMPTKHLTTSSWSFDGFFQKSSEVLPVKFPENILTEVEITSLNIYPLEFADPQVEISLRKQGETLWSCRHRLYVSYIKDVEGFVENGDSRYMIDMGIYKQMHPPSTSTAAKGANRDDLGPEVMASDEPPSGFFTLLLPNIVIGFNMLEKKWVDLEVSRIRPVTWNKMVFESLVVDPDIKVLIQALVTNQIAAEQSTDLMSGKGNGLIVLLHGGPGTGKTLTAESVAEIAEKPLYRVTCGDIGTNPEVVEKYLETVLYLGKVWRCVVLLDEADVFLEQRTLADLQRNALVSVFLRVLEYYSGILVLTSNRVGTFDEAFKSRIQLSLRYENLTEDQRCSVWKNFIDRLETFESIPNTNDSSPNSSLTTSKSRALNTPLGDASDVAIDIAELRAHLPDLAKHSMNGRQIRNALTTARQLALYKKKPMGYAELHHVIGVAGKFDKYLLEINGNVNDDTVARELEYR